MFFFIGWIILSLVVGTIGSKRRIGFRGAFYVSVLVSPVIGLFITLASKSLKAEWYEKQMLKAQRRQVASLKKIEEQQAAETSKKSVSEELENLRQLKEAGHLTDEEYQQAKSKVIAAA